MYTVRPPLRLNRFFKDLLWNVETDDLVVYLTFDDGPHPEITPWVMGQLNNYQAKGTFFCIGNNVETYPEIYNDIIEKGHAVGNHSYEHINGWRASYPEYKASIDRCASLVKSTLFRPPYGRIKPNHIPKLKGEYTIVMWDTLSGDYDENTTPEHCLKNVLDHVRPGSIIVFHDSEKARKNLEYTLPRALKELSAKGYRFEGLSAL